MGRRNIPCSYVKGGCIGQKCDENEEMANLK